MKKLTKLAVMLTLIIPILNLAVSFMLFYTPTTHLIIEPSIDWGFVVAMIFVFFFGMSLFLRIFSVYRKKRLESFLFLMLYLMCLWACALVSTLWSIFSITNPNIQFSYISTTTLLFNSALFFLYIFGLDIFYKGLDFPPNKKKATTYGVILLMFDLLICLGINLQIYSQIFIIYPFLQLILSSVPNYLLISIGFLLPKKIIETKPKRGFKFLGIAGILTILGFILIAVFSYLDYFKVAIVLWLPLISWGLWAVSSFFLYQGFIYPMQKSPRHQ